MIRLTSTLQTRIQSHENLSRCLSRLLEVRCCCSFLGSNRGQCYGLVCEPYKRLIPCSNACYRAFQMRFSESQPQSSIPADVSNAIGLPTLEKTNISMVSAYIGFHTSYRVERQILFADTLRPKKVCVPGSTRGIFLPQSMSGIVIASGRATSLHDGIATLQSIGLDKWTREIDVQAYLVTRQAKLDANLLDRVTDIGHNLTPDEIRRTQQSLHLCFEPGRLPEYRSWLLNKGSDLSLRGNTVQQDYRSVAEDLELCPDSPMHIPELLSRMKEPPCSR
jgi:hypothetical protein